MVADHYSRVYARQEYLTPGNPETVDCLVDAIGSGRDARVLEVACGKGEAACEIASRAGCTVVALDPHPPFLRHALAKIERRGLGEVVRLVRGDGTRLPFPDGSFDAGACMGAPSIVGLEPCLRELGRTVRAGGPVVVSDVYWHHLPSTPLGPEWRWLAGEQPRLSLDEYRRALTHAGMDVEEALVHDEAAWEAYQAPMMLAAAAERARGEAAFADDVEQGIEVERRAVAAFIGYVTFITRVRDTKPA
jgi:ubiquinone/menaquinone biosynthesis C-methylase UbiE